MPRALRLTAVAACLAASLLMTWQATRGTPDSVWRFEIASPAAGSPVPRFEQIAEFRPETGIAHAPAILGDGAGFSVLWFEGSKEAMPDVVIRSALFGPDTIGVAPSEATTLLTPDALTARTLPVQSVRVLGNTIGKTDPVSGYYGTILSIGGWATAMVADIGPEPESPVRRLDLSPILGRSHLVRSPALRFADGDTALPVYFEMGNAFAELARIGPDGRVRAKRRIASGRHAIQPMIVATDPLNAVALMRNLDDHDRLYASWTRDGGNSWSPPTLLDLPNDDAPVAALPLSDGRLLMAFNDGSDRNLSLAVSGDTGRNWDRVTVIEDHGETPESDVRYPALHRLPDGGIVLAYSFGSKHGIRVVRFNEAWLAAQ